MSPGPTTATSRVCNTRTQMYTVEQVADRRHQRQQHHEQANLEQDGLAPSLLAGGARFWCYRLCRGPRPPQAGQVAGRDGNVTDQHRPAGRPVLNRRFHQASLPLSPLVSGPA